MHLAEQINDRRAAEDHAANTRAGLVASAVYNVNRKRGSRPIGPGEFFKQNGSGRRREQTWEEVHDVMQVIMIRQQRAKEGATRVGPPITG